MYYERCANSRAERSRKYMSACPRCPSQIAPGYIATTNTEPLQADETRNRQILKRIPLPLGSRRDLAGAALSPSSAASDYVAGTVLTVDGEWMER